MGEYRHGGRRRSRSIAAGAAALLVALGAVTVWQTTASGATGYRTAVSAPETIRQTESASGNVAPVHQASASFQVSGRVSRVDVTLGQHVTAGQKLASVDSTALQDNVSAAEKALAADKAALRENEADQASGTSSASSSGLGTSTSGGKSGGSSSTSSGTSAAYDSAQQLASDRAQIDTAEAQLATAKQSLADATLTSPLTGTIEAVNLTAGQTVSADDSSHGIVIGNSSGYEATAYLDDSQMSGVKVGDHVDVSVNGRGGTVAGTVSRIDPVQESNGNYVYPVVVALSGLGGQIPWGSTAALTILLRSVSHTLAVPTSAVHSAAAGDSYVQVLKDGQPTEQRVGVGVVGGRYTQITSGLTKGETVVLADLSQPLPTSSSGTTRRFGGAGGFGGTSLP